MSVFARNGNGDGGPGAERAVGERSSGAGVRSLTEAPDPELVERAQRRRFTSAYKLAIVHEADGLAQKPGEVLPAHRLGLELAGQLPAALEGAIRDMQTRHLGAEQVRSSRQGYYGSVSFIDEQIGRMIATLKRTGQYDNTLIMLVSDALRFL